jgi:hypothetical protein
VHPGANNCFLQLLYKCAVNGHGRKNEVMNFCVPAHEVNSFKGMVTVFSNSIFVHNRLLCERYALKFCKAEILITSFPLQSGK